MKGIDFFIPCWVGAKLKQFEGVTLRIDSGEWKGREFSVARGQSFVVGREVGGADIAIAVDRSISRNHFVIDCLSEKPLIHDRGSTNGTFLNGSKLTTTGDLTHGSVIRAGQTRFIIEWIKGEQDLVSSIYHSESGVSEFVQPSTDEIPPVVWDAQPQTPPSAGPVAHADPSPFVMEPHFEDEDVPAPLRGEWDGPEVVVVEESGEIDFSKFDSYEMEVSDGGPFSIEPRFVADVETSHRKISKGIHKYRIWSAPEGVFPKLLDSLLEVGEFLAVPHFRKIGQEVPEGVETIPLFPGHGPSDGLLPVGILGDDWVKHCNRRWTRELVAHDAIVVVFGRDCTQIVEQLHSGGLPGFSVANGFLGWFWPSQLQVMLAATSRGHLETWFGDQAFGICYPNRGESCVDCWVNGPLDYDLSRLGFDDWDS